MKGIVLAGGDGTRLYPLTKIVSKHLMPVAGKPMIYYPLSALLLVGVKDILIIGKENDIVNYKKLFNDGTKFGLTIKYKEQNEPNGIAEAFLIGEEFIGDEDVCLILGDNLFWSGDIKNYFEKGKELLKENNVSAIVYACTHPNPSSFGVIEVVNKKVVAILEKPKNPPRNMIVPGLYMYNKSVIEVAKNIKKSNRNELEITDVNNLFLKKGELKVVPLGRSFIWTDMGTSKTLQDASELVQKIQDTNGMQVANLEEICYYEGHIDDKEFEDLIKEMPQCEYKEYLEEVLNGVKRRLEW